MKTYSYVLEFWFQKNDSKLWYAKDTEFDALVEAEFKKTHCAAIAGELFNWRQSAGGRLAEIIVLDQFSRNIFRNQPRAFQSDGMALVLSQEGVSKNILAELKDSEAGFFIMPFMHSESSLIHEQAIKLFSRPGLESGLEFELKHKAIIDRFGRYPHRNQILGRESTREEEEFLKLPGSSF